MKIIVEFNDGVSYELDDKQLNPKQIELIAYIFDIPEMKKCIIGQNK